MAGFAAAVLLYEKQNVYGSKSISFFPFILQDIKYAGRPAGLSRGATTGRASPKKARQAGRLKGKI